MCYPFFRLLHSILPRRVDVEPSPMEAMVSFKHFGLWVSLEPVFQAFFSVRDPEVLKNRPLGIRFVII